MDKDRKSLKTDHTKKRRDDEASLNYVLERDLDRNAIFELNNGWYTETSTTKKYKNGGMKGRIDYIVRFGDRLIGIDMKAYFPKLRECNVFC